MQESNQHQLASTIASPLEAEAKRIQTSADQTRFLHHQKPPGLYTNMRRPARVLRSLNWAWVEIQPPGIGPQVVVQVSIYQGKQILGTYCSPAGNWGRAAYHAPAAGLSACSHPAAPKPSIPAQSASNLSRGNFQFHFFCRDPDLSTKKQTHTHTHTISLGKWIRFLQRTMVESAP